MNLAQMTRGLTLKESDHETGDITQILCIRGSVRDSPRRDGGAWRGPSGSAAPAFASKPGHRRCVVRCRAGGSLLGLRLRCHYARAGCDSDRTVRDALCRAERDEVRGRFRTALGLVAAEQGCRTPKTGESRFVSGPGRPGLIRLMDKMPDSRLLEGRFMTVNHRIGTPRERRVP